MSDYVIANMKSGDTFQIIGLQDSTVDEDVLLRVESVTRHGSINCSLIFNPPTREEWERTIVLSTFQMTDLVTAIEYGWYVPGTYDWYERIKSS